MSVSRHLDFANGGVAFVAGSSTVVLRKAHVSRTSQRPYVLFAALALAVGSVACNDNDIGKSCPELLTQDQKDHLVTVNDDGTATVVETYGTSVSYQCDELICVASQGRDGYCTKECRSNDSCPTGFVCRSVSAGDFARNLCTWNTCSKDTDCGDEAKMVCRSVENVFPGEDFKLCAFKN